jgi:hypothetical protein
MTAIPSQGTIIAVRGINRSLTRAEIKLVRENKLLFFAHGRIEYRDTFGKKRWTTYRTYYSGIWPPKHPLMNFTNEGNDTDQSEREVQTASPRSRDYLM